MLRWSSELASIGKRRMGKGTGVKTEERLAKEKTDGK